jgi:hypothetical protein
MPHWVLEDVEVAAKQHPDSFFIPPEAERRARKRGDQVRLHFVLAKPSPDQPRAERMWVEIADVRAAGCEYTGVLTNQPRYIPGLNAGDTVHFEPRHIARTTIGKDDPGWIDCGEKSALVSKLVFEGDKTVRFAYREEPDREEDSGWRLFSGQETDEDTNDPANIRVCNVLWLTDFDPSLLEVFRHGPGSVFERSGKDSEWEKVEDWSPSPD